MSRILIAISALMLAGCADTDSYDKSAVPDAAAAMRQAMAICETQHIAAKFTACEVAAERDFAVAIHLPKMDAFDAYAAQMKALAADWDAGRVSAKQMAARATSIRDHYWFACNCGLRDRRGSGSFPEMFVPSPNPTTTSLGQ